MGSHIKLFGTVIAVFAMIACAGLIVSEDSDAEISLGDSTGSESSPLTGLSGDFSAYFDTLTYYVQVGSTVEIVGTNDEDGAEYITYYVESVSSGFGLSVVDYEVDTYNVGKLTGTISKAGDITVSGKVESSQGNSSQSIHIVAVNNEQYIDFSSPEAVDVVAGSSISYTAQTNVGATFEKTGGTATWLSVSSNGKVTGTAPSVSSITEYTCIIKATSTSVSSNTATQTVTFTVYPAAKITASPSNTITGSVGSAVSSVTLSGNIAMTFSGSGWPSGISMSNGVISGTPASVSDASVTVYGYSTEGPSQTAEITIFFHISEGSLTITSTAPTQTYLTGSSYTYTPTASLSDVTWSISGAPEWLSVSGGSVVGSIPASYSEAGSVTYTLTAKSVGGQTVSQQVTIKYEPHVEFTSVPTASCVVEPVYDYDSDGNPTMRSGILGSSAAMILSSGASTLEDSIDYITPDAVDAITGATFTYNAAVNISGSTFERISGADWLSVTSQGVVSGTAPSVTEKTDYQIVIRATSPQGQTADQTVTITVYPIAQLTSTALATQVHQGSEMVTITVTSNVQVTWSKSGDLPDGVSFSDGVLSGTPTVQGSFPIVIYGTTIEGPSQTASIKVTITVGEPVLQITSSYPTGLFKTGSSYTYTPTANVEGVTWSISGDDVSGFLAVSGGSVVGQIPTSYDDGVVLNYVLKAVSPEGQEITQAVSINVEPDIAFTTVPVASCVVNPVYDYNDDGTYGTVTASKANAFLLSMGPVLTSVDDSPYVILADSAEETKENATVDATGTRTYRFTWTGEYADRVVWDFGDGTTGEGYSVIHTYADDGTYTYTCTGINDLGESSVSGKIVVDLEDDDGSDILLYAGIVLIVLILIVVAYYLHKRKFAKRIAVKTNGRR